VSWLLNGLLEDVPGARAVLLLSADGLCISSSRGTEKDHEDVLSAVASAAISLARGASGQLGDGKVARQVVFILGQVSLFIVSAAQGSVLAVLAGNNVDSGVLAWEMDRLAKSVRPHLATQPRPRPAAPAPAGPTDLPPARVKGTDL
jgi:predicted regulator of Ras-like GTPase activity (Roadblock/LC7/MglB family)